MSNQPCLPVPRRRKRISSSDDEGRSSLSFREIDSMDAMDYMAAVAQQAGAMPDFFVAKPSTTTEDQEQRVRHDPIDGSATSLAYLVSGRSEILEAPTSHHIPHAAQKWVDATIANFAQLRHVLQTCYENGVGGKTGTPYSVPPLRDRTGWHLFCVGREEARGNVGAYFDEDEHDSDSDEPDSSWRRDLPSSGHEPTVRLICQMDQVMVRRVIAHLFHYLNEGWPCTPRWSAWMYALLVNLERPLHGEDAALLYSLLRELTRLRSKTDVKSEREKLARINVLIVLVGIYFEQGGGYHGVMSVTQK